jgi:hypothetical protein
MVLCNIEHSFWDATASIRLTKKFTIVRLDCENQIHALVMDEEYVQEHIWIGCIVAPVGGASPTHSRPLTAIALCVVPAAQRGK